ncbi:MAG: hypothetical protein U9N81_08730 [Bacillota bacterium]|nr:hypothetical protein [Bacillota bacterium]
MRKNEENLDKLCESTAKTIFNLYFTTRIDQQEKAFLLNLLGTVASGKHRELFKALEQWLEATIDDEVHEIIHATIVNVDLTSEESIADAVRIINELLAYEQE